MSTASAGMGSRGRSDWSSQSPARHSSSQVVLFDLAGTTYAMAVESIEEIIELQAITPVPGAEVWVEGTTLFRDRVVPVLNLARRFGLSGTGPTDDTRIVVVAGGEGFAGLVVDAVSEVVDVPGSRMEPVSSIVTNGANGYLSGIAKLDGQLVCVVDVERIVPTAAA
jgi:purine-binding chemotaxis protein CheW